MSFNVLASLEKSELVQVSSTLASLNLSHNRLSSLTEDSLKGFESLRDLDLSNNELSSLAPTVFSGHRKLERLLLQNNSLSLLPASLLSDLSALTVLNLSRNAISSHLLESSDTFSGLGALFCFTAFDV